MTSTPVKRVTRASAKITGMLPEDSVIREVSSFQVLYEGCTCTTFRDFSFTLKDKVVGYCLQTFLAGIYTFFY